MEEESKRTEKKVLRSHSSSNNNNNSSKERTFVAGFLTHPDVARLHVLSRGDVLLDECSLLERWGALEGAYGSALDSRLLQRARELDSVRGSNMANALAAVVGSFQSLGKQHVGLETAIEAQLSQVLRPLVKEQKRIMEELTSEQVTLQRETAQALEAWEKKRDESEGMANKARLTVQKHMRAQENGLRHFLASLWALWKERSVKLATSIEVIKRTSAHVLEFNEEVVSALNNILSAVDVDTQVKLDVATILKVQPDDLCEKQGIKETGALLATQVYEALGHVEPDAASGSVDAVIQICTTAITVCQVASGITGELATALDQRGKDVDSLASKLELRHLQVSCEYSDVYSEDQTKESERNAWRSFLIIMKQSSMVLADLSAKVSRCSAKFGELALAHERAKQQVIAARNAANKELQLVANGLKEARSKLEGSDDAINKANQAVEKITSDLNDLRAKWEKNSSKKARASSTTAAQVNEDLSEQPPSLPQTAAPSATAISSPNKRPSSPSISSVTSTSSALSDTVDAAASGTTAGGVSDSGDSKEKAGNVVQRFFGLSSQPLEEQIQEMEEKLSKAKFTLQVAQEHRDTLRSEVQVASERVESQIQAFAVQIAGTVSGFVSAHVSRVREFKSTLEQVVQGAVDYTATIQQLQSKQMSELSRMDLLKDIEVFMEKATKSKQENAETPVITVPELQTSLELEQGSHVDDSLLDGENEADAKQDTSFDKPASNKHHSSKGALQGFALPSEEKALGTFSCAYLPGKVPQQGRLVCTNHFLCFSTLSIYEPMLGSCKVVVHFSQVAKVTKAASAWGLVANSLVVHLKPLRKGQTPPELYFTSLFFRDKCFDLIASLSTKNQSVYEPPVDAPWRTLDPRLGDEYTGNTLVITLKDSSTPDKKKKRGSGFMRLGLSHRDFDNNSSSTGASPKASVSADEQGKIETEEAEEKVADSNAKSKDTGKDSEQTQANDVEKKLSAGRKMSSRKHSGTRHTDTKPFTMTCAVCKTPPGDTPCRCWKLRGKDVVLNHDHKLLSDDFFQGDLETNVAVLFLGLQVPNPSLDRPSACDIAKALGEKLGDYEQSFPSFKRAKGPEDYTFSRHGFAAVQAVEEEGRSNKDESLARVVSFIHPIGNTPFGKQVANTTQLQRVWGCKVDDETGAVKVEGDSVEICYDTSLAGFPYADCFVVRTRHVLSALHNERRMHPDEAWCRLDTSCRVVWQKTVSVPFLKGKIEKENIQTGKKNMVEWLRLARAQTVSHVAEYPQKKGKEELVRLQHMTTQAAGSEGKGEEKQMEAKIALDELWSRSFYETCWQESSKPQKLQTLILCLIILLQMYIILFK